MNEPRVLSAVEHSIDYRAATEWPEHPYPGSRPAASFVLDTDQTLRVLVPDQRMSSGWRVGADPVRGACLDTWLLARTQAPLADRKALLAYGSNANPSKLAAWAGLLPAVVLRCTLTDAAAAWCNGTRSRGDVPATLVAAPGACETHSVMLVTSAHLEIIDSFEGRTAGRTSNRYDLLALSECQVSLETGYPVANVYAYVGGREERHPLADPSDPDRGILFAGSVAQSVAAALVVSGRGRRVPDVKPLGRIVTRVTGEPAPTTRATLGWSRGPFRPASVPR